MKDVIIAERDKELVEKNIKLAKEVLDGLVGERNFLLFVCETAAAPALGPTKTMAGARMVGHLEAEQLAILLSELHYRIQGDTRVMDLAARLLAVRTGTTKDVGAEVFVEKDEFQGPLDLSGMGLKYVEDPVL